MLIPITGSLRRKTATIWRIIPQGPAKNSVATTCTLELKLDMSAGVETLSIDMLAV